MKNISSLLLGSALLLMGNPLQAAYDFPFFNQGGGYCGGEDTCAAWDPSEFQYGLNPPIACPVDDCGTFGVYGEFLWMRATQDDTFAYSIQNLTHDTSTTYVNDYKRVKFDPDWEAGFRIGAMYKLPCDSWSVDVNWMYFYEKNSKTSPTATATYTDATTELVGSLVRLPNSVSYGVPFTTLGEDATITTSATSSFKLRFNQVDADLTREFYVGPAMTLRPYFGFRALVIDETISGVAQTVLDITTDETYDTTQSMKQNCSAYGGHGGLRATYEICDGFSLYGDVGSHVVWSHYKTHFTRTTIQDGVDGFSTVVNKESCDVMRFGGEFKGGIQWITAYDCNQNIFFVRAGWEHHIFLSQNIVKTMINGANDGVFLDSDAQNGATFFNTGGGDLALYGLTVGIGVTF